MERETLKSRLALSCFPRAAPSASATCGSSPILPVRAAAAHSCCFIWFSGHSGSAHHDHGVCGGSRLPQEPVRAYQALEKPGQKWHIHGYLTLIGCYLLMMFYTTVAGWMLHYFYMTAIGQLSGLNAEQVAGKFTEMLASPSVMTFWMVFVVALGILVCAKGLQNGLERVTKVMMIALLAIMVVLAVNSLFMPGAKRASSSIWCPILPVCRRWAWSTHWCRP